MQLKTRYKLTDEFCNKHNKIVTPLPATSMQLFCQKSSLPTAKNESAIWFHQIWANAQIAPILLYPFSCHTHPCRSLRQPCNLHQNNY